MKMVYIEYDMLKQKYIDAQVEYDKILSEMEELFIITQPSAIRYDKDTVSGGTGENTYDVYLAQKERLKIDERLKESETILDARKKLLALKKEELYASRDWCDMIYRYRYIDNLPVNQIISRMPYCKSHIYRLLDQIKKNINMRKNETKTILEY